MDRNDLVEEGQVLATLKSNVEEATVALAEARAKASGRTESRREAMAFGRRKLARTEELYQKKVVSFNAKDEAATDARIARLAFQEAEEDKIIAGLEMQRAIELLNQRMADYAEFGYSEDEGPSFGMKRFFGDQVKPCFDGEDQKWASSQVMDIEVPEVMTHLKRATPNLFM